ARATVSRAEYTQVPTFFSWGTIPFLVRCSSTGADRKRQRGGIRPRLVFGVVGKSDIQIDRVRRDAAARCAATCAGGGRNGDDAGRQGCADRQRAGTVGTERGPAAR